MERRLDSGGSPNDQIRRPFRPPLTVPLTQCLNIVFGSGYVWNTERIVCENDEFAARRTVQRSGGVSRGVRKPLRLRKPAVWRKSAGQFLGLDPKATKKRAPQFSGAF
jgi:hypothetical protein